MPEKCETCGQDLPLFDPSDLDLALYRIYWRSGGSSLASVGYCDDGTRWMAPTNWLGGHGEPWTDWSGVLRVERLYV